MDEWTKVYHDSPSGAMQALKALTMYDRRWATPAASGGPGGWMVYHLRDAAQEWVTVHVLLAGYAGRTMTEFAEVG